MTSQNVLGSFFSFRLLFNFQSLSGKTLETIKLSPRRNTLILLEWHHCFCYCRRADVRSHSKCLSHFKEVSSNWRTRIQFWLSSAAQVIWVQAWGWVISRSGCQHPIFPDIVLASSRVEYLNINVEW